MSIKAWKRTESAVASHLGGKRVPITGRQRGDVPDIAHTWLSPEVKHRQEIPKWLTEALDQALAARKDGQLAVAVIHEQGRHHANDLVILRLGDFVKWFGGAASLDTLEARVAEDS